MYQANSPNNTGYQSINNPVGGQPYNSNAPGGFFNNNYNSNMNQNISYQKQPLSTVSPSSQSQPQMQYGNNRLPTNNANTLQQDTQQTQPVARYAYTGNIGNASPRTQQLTQQQQQQQTQQIQYSANIPPPKTFSQQPQQSSQSQGYLQNPQATHQAFENNYDSFSGSMVDEGISASGGPNFMPESKQIYGSKQGIIPSDAFQRGSGSPSHQMATHQFQPTVVNPQRLQQQQQQSTSQVNDLAYQLNQIRIASKQPKENVPEELTNSNAFKIVNKDTGEVFDIRQFDGEQKKNNNSNINRSPLHSNNINSNITQSTQPNQYPTQQQSQSQQALHTGQQPLTFQQASVYQTASSSNINISNSSVNNNNNNTNAWTEWWNKKRKNNGDLLLQAKINNTNACLELLDKKLGDMRADVNAKDASNEWTSLHYGCQNGNTKLVSQLLYYEATIDSESAIQQTPLIIAAISGYEDISQLLITAGADINFQDSNGNTPLHHACLNGNKKIVEMLLKKPSLDWKCPNKLGKEPYELCKDEEIKKVFDNFFVFQKAMMKKNPRVRIFNANQDTVSQMFSHNNNGSPQQTQQTGNFFNTNVKQQQQEQSPLEKQISNNYLSTQKSQSSENKSSFGTSDADTSNMSDEEKVGPNSFIVHGLIGKGSFGEVYLVEKKDSQQLYAMKVLHKSKIMRHNLTRYALTERNVLSVTKHPFIVRLNYAFQTPDKLFLILKYCPGGDLGEHLQKEKRFTEDRVRNYLAEITLALEHLHKKDVIFRDLKPDNIVLDHEGHAMLTDFGLSKEGVLDHSTGAKSFCGSVAYLAPEMLKRCGHGKAVDWYLLGVVMYELLVGIPPYYANNKEELFDNIEKGHLKLPSFLSADARSLLKALLQRNPVKRLGSGKGDSDEIKAHPFFASIIWEDAEQRKLNVPIPNRKIRISTKFDPNVFEPSSFVENGKEYIPGWSFVDHNADQVNYNLNQQ